MTLTDTGTGGHTPGPWTFEPQEGPKGRCLAAQVYGPDGRAIADIESTDPEKFANANARLIAAAPEMFEALKPFAAFLDAMDKMGGNFPKAGPFYTLTAHGVGEREITVEDFRAARAAISKATGAAP